MAKDAEDVTSQTDNHSSGREEPRKKDLKGEEEGRARRLADPNQRKESVAKTAENGVLCARENRESGQGLIHLPLLKNDV